MVARRTSRYVEPNGAVFALALATATFAVPAPASAQWRPFFFFGDEPTATVQPRPVTARPVERPRRVERVARAERSGPSLLPAKSSGRVLIAVSTDHQTLTVYDDGVPVAHTSISTGVADHPTPLGIFSVIEKQRFHASNIYSAAPMPFMQRLTWSGVALHEGHVTGRPASHGCIRLPPAFATDLFRYTREGARVIIAHEDPVPTPLGAMSFLTAATAQHDESAAPLPADVEIEARPRGTGTPPTEGVRKDFGAASPISILVSRKAGKLYVRRASKPLMTVPIVIDDLPRPLGTHLFTAGADPTRSWSAVTLNTPVVEASNIDNATRPRRARDVPSMPLAASTSWDALSRLHLAPGTSALLASMLTPGATLILSDDGARGRETWDGTNFIALSE